LAEKVSNGFRARHATSGSWIAKTLLRSASRFPRYVSPERHSSSTRFLAGNSVTAPGWHYFDLFEQFT
jgi:hypothetical protein